MRDTIEQRVEKIRRGYVVQTNPRRCGTCGCVCQPERSNGNYYCRPHRFNVNSQGVCVDWQKEPWADPAAAAARETPLINYTYEQLFK